MNEQLGRLLALDGRVALVAGGAGAIGAAASALLRDAGATVVVADLPDCPGPAGTIARPCDLAQPAAVRALVEDLAREQGRLDIVVHAAGVARDAVLWKLAPEDWSAVMALNLDSAFHLLAAAAPVLRRTGGGSVVLISSINAERGKLGQASYAASKAGLNALARTAAREMGRFNVRVNAIAPGWIDTPMTSGLPQEARQRALDETVLGRLGEPRDVAGAVLFLCSELGRHVTGQVLRVDGGQLIA